MEETTEKDIRRKLEFLEEQIKNFDFKIISIAEGQAEHIRELYKRLKENESRIKELEKRKLF